MLKRISHFSTYSEYRRYLQFVQVPHIFESFWMNFFNVVVHESSEKGINLMTGDSIFAYTIPGDF